MQPRLAESNWIATCCKTEEFESFALVVALLVLLSLLYGRSFLCNEYFLAKNVVGIKNDTYICTDTKVVYHARDI